MILIVFKTIFAKIDVGDEVMVFLDDNQYVVDVVVNKSEEYIYTANYGKFSIQDVFSGAISLCGKN